MGQGEEASLKAVDEQKGRRREASPEKLGEEDSSRGHVVVFV